MTPPDSSSLLAEIRALLQSARATAARQINALAVLTNFEIGRRIVEHEQGGEARAEYGRGVLQSLSASLTEEFGRGWSVDNLSLMRWFYLGYADRLPISETPSRISGSGPGSLDLALTGKSETASRISLQRPSCV